MDGQLDRYGIGWMVALKACGQHLNVQAETSDK